MTYAPRLELTSGALTGFAVGAFWPDLTEAGSPVSKGLVQAAVLLGQRLGARVFAEGLGTAEQKRVLERLGCAEAQGPFFGAALSAAAAGERLRAER